MTIKDTITIRPIGQSYRVGFDSELYATKTESLKDANILKAFYQYLEDKTDGQFAITKIGMHSRGVTPVTIRAADGTQSILNINVFDFLEELDLNLLCHMTFSSPSTFGKNREKALQIGNFRDGFTLAATSYFDLTQQKVSEVPRQWNFFDPQSRIVVDKDHVVLTNRGLSRFESLFYRFFNPGIYQKYLTQNTATIDAYQKFLVREVGLEKVALIEKTFGISLEKMKSEGHPLLPSHVHYFNTGINYIEMSDVEAFQEKIQDVLQNCNEGQTVMDFFTQGNHDFTMREMRGMLALFQNPTTATMGQLKTQFETAFFNRCVDAVMTPRADWEGAYTGRKFNAPIKGSYNTDVDDKETLRYEIDMQELAQVHHEILDVNPNSNTIALRIFNEYLIKIAAKKHLMVSAADGSDWRVGAIIPSPFKDSSGETVWYRVDQAVDSAHGKLWYVFKPANEDVSRDFPVFRAMRDTCRQSYALRAGPTISRDVAQHAGYKYSNTTELEDREFFDQYTLPVWMSYLFVAEKESDPKKQIQALKTASTELIEEFSYRLSTLSLTPAEKQQYRQQIQSLQQKNKTFFANSHDKNSTQDFINQLKKSASKKDRILYDNLLIGKHPPQVVSAGNSLGGFDAQFDVVKHTAYRHRLPITPMHVYSHSTLKIHNDDDREFTSFLKKHKDVMKTMGGDLAFDHITEEGDIVSMFGRNRTFLGNELKKDFQFNFRVFKPLKTSQSPQIQQVKTHIRRVEGLEAGTDIIWKNYDVESYEAYSQQKRIALSPIDAWHRRGVKLGLFEASDSTWRLSRYFKGVSPYISWENRNKKLIVEHKKGFRFNPIHWSHLQTERRQARKSS